MDGGTIFLLIVFWVVSGFIGLAIGSSKGRSGEGFALGLLLGFIGWIIVAVMGPSVEVQRQRDEALASAIAGATGSQSGGHVQATSSAGLRRCPFCAELIQGEAIKCRYCGEFIEPLSPAEVAVQLASPSIVPPGWYPDPLDPTERRRFDGHAWQPKTNDRAADASKLEDLRPPSRQE